MNSKAVSAKNNLCRGLLAFGLIFGVNVFLGVSVAQSFPHSNDPLSAEEIARVTIISAPTSVAARSADTSNPNNMLLNDKQEVLLIERHQQKGAPQGQRRADVYIYDYQTNELIESLVDLNTSEVLNTNRKQGVQLPLTTKELARAKQIVFDDEDERQILEHEYQRITSKPLTSTAELNIKAFTFTADSLPNRVNEASKYCGVHRCAQLMLYTGENIVFEISPIVNLSEGVVTQRIGF
jgi:Cu2+-containing amine oxidase